MERQYVENVGGAYRIAGSRVSLDSVVFAYWNGHTAEGIAQAFPAVTPEQVYGAIAFYLAHRAEVDEYLRQGRADFDALREKSRSADPMFYQKLATARSEPATP
jgi:uncharacterized protein (DUF433 family)